MAIRRNGAIRRQLGTLFNLGVIAELTDGQLLERFATRGGEAAELAFAALVERHGPMVLRVCRSALRDQNDVQDAFQATFLVLVQKARLLWVADSIGPWLHRVAHRVASRARASATRRRRHERQAAANRQTLVSERGDWDDCMALLHEEIDRLPERYRAPLVLCDLQGLTHEKAARHLGWPIGTVKSRLAKARELLRGRLSRHDLGMPAVPLIAGQGLARALRVVEDELPSTLVESTVHAATLFAAGRALALGMVSTRVAMLIEEVLKAMFLTKLKMASMVMLFIGAAGAAGVLAQSRSGSAESPAMDQSQKAESAGSRVEPEVDSPSAPAPAYIKQSRVMIITRLQEEVAESRARLDRTLLKVQSPQDPAVVHARKTFEDLLHRLDKIDRVLVDVVETYPTMFDFSGGPFDFASNSQPAASSNQKNDNAGNQLGVEPPDRVDRAHAQDRAEWAKRMFDRGYVSKSQLDAELTNSQKTNGQSQSGQPRHDKNKESQPGENSGNQKGKDQRNSSGRHGNQGQQGKSQQGQSPDKRGSSQGQSTDQQQGKSPNLGEAGQEQPANQQQGNVPDPGKAVPQ